MSLFLPFCYMVFYDLQSCSLRIVRHLGHGDGLYTGISLDDERTVQGYKPFMLQVSLWKPNLQPITIYNTLAFCILITSPHSPLNNSYLIVGGP
jgi:hypothetical protein